MDSISKSKSKAGFTLAEILLAMMVFAIAISTILALLARSIETADSILVKDEAIALSSAVDSFMSELPFAEAFNGVVNGAAPYVFAYQFKARKNGDGTLTPVAVLNDSDQLGSTYLVVPRVRGSTETELDSEVTAREGRLFRVNLEVSPANPLGTNLGGRDPDSVDDTSGYNSAVLVIFAEFYQVPDTGATPATDPVFSFNFAVRR
jgi:type II secretory pathway pseudopilin PulG